MKERVTNAERRHMDYLRRTGLKAVQVYEARLLRLRRKEVRRVLDLCTEWDDPSVWPGVIQQKLTEDYLPGWWDGLFVDAGLGMAKSTARDLRKEKAAGENGIWTEMLLQYAFNRSGEAIVGVTGTLKDTLLAILADRMANELEGGIEKLANAIYRDFDGMALWECRRIAQTEGMIAMADAAAGAASTLDVRFTKTWATSGLSNTRESHLVMDGVTVAEDEPFELEGGLVMYPHDTSMGADAAEIINCACSCLRRTM